MQFIYLVVYYTTSNIGWATCIPASKNVNLTCTGSLFGAYSYLGLHLGTYCSSIDLVPILKFLCLSSHVELWIHKILVAGKKSVQSPCWPSLMLSIWVWGWISLPKLDVFSLYCEGWFGKVVYKNTLTFNKLWFAQVVISIIIPKMGGSKSLNTKNWLKFVVFFQYVPRLFRIYPLYKEVTRTSGILTQTAWAGAAFNLLLYMLASHVSFIKWPFFFFHWYLGENTFFFKNICLLSKFIYLFTYVGLL